VEQPADRFFIHKGRVLPVPWDTVYPAEVGPKLSGQ
jgi:hypothetical protein